MWCRCRYADISKYGKCGVDVVTAISVNRGAYGQHRVTSIGSCLMAV
jgi:hypothetical protein